MIASHPLPATIVLALIIAMSACQRPTNIASPPPGGPVSETNQSTDTKSATSASLTAIELRPSDAKKLRIDSYYSMYSYGPVQYFYHFETHGALLHLYIPNEAATFSPTARLHFFSDKDAPHINKWINNQHSDGLYADAPSPQESVDLSGQISIPAKSKLTPTTGRNGESYDVYELTIALEAWQRPPYILKAFEENTLVRVRLTDGPEVGLEP